VAKIMNEIYGSDAPARRAPKELADDTTFRYVS